MGQPVQQSYYPQLANYEYFDPSQGNDVVINP